MKKTILAMLATLALAVPAVATADPHGKAVGHNREQASTTASTFAATAAPAGFIATDGAVTEYAAVGLTPDESYSAGCTFTPEDGSMTSNIGQSSRPADASGQVLFMSMTNFLTRGKAGRLDCWVVEGSVNPFTAPRLAETTSFLP